MSNKGYRFEVLCQKKLEKEGYIVHRAMKSVRRFGLGIVRTISHDIFGLFDLVAMKEDNLKFIQCTTSKNISIKKKKILAVSKKDKLFDGAEYLIWQKIGRNKIRELRLNTWQNIFELWND